MTIVCYKDGVMASDSTILSGDLIVGSTQKVWKFKDGTLMGGSGAIAQIQCLADWWESEGEADRPKMEDLDLDDCTVLLVDPVEGVSKIQFGSFPTKSSDEFYAIGSGSEIAMGAMEQGASAVQAVEICIKRTITCGGDVQTVLKD